MDGLSVFCVGTLESVVSQDKEHSMYRFLHITQKKKANTFHPQTVDISTRHAQARPGSLIPVTGFK